jgi:Protein of unknown function (DUF3300)
VRTPRESTLEQRRRVPRGLRHPLAFLAAFSLASAAAIVAGCASTPPPGTPPPPPPQQAPPSSRGPPPAQSQAPSAPASPSTSGQIPPDQLDSLVAPIALYPDPLLAQVLAASTYPVEIIQLQQWLAKNSGLKDKALADAVAKQPWDPSVQALAGLPEVVKRLADDIQWTTDLGNAFLAQEQGVMDAVQRMRAKAKANGNLASTQQQVVKTEEVEGTQVIVIEQANPQVVYVPSYSPVVVYGPPVYPYPPIYYPPPPPPGSLAISFGIGLAMGAWMGGAWGWGCGWGHSSTVVINNNNNFIRAGGGAAGNGNRWQHRPEHRGGTPYRDASTANRYGGNRGAGVSTQPAGGAGGRGPGASTQPAGGAGGRAPGVSTQPAGGGDRIGDRSVSSGGGNRSGFGGGSEGFSGSRTNAASSRGASSTRSRGGGGRGGGGRRR